METNGTRPQRVLIEGNDFYSCPRLDPDGSRLAWLSWNHPNMPWDKTDSGLPRLRTEGTLDSPQRIAGGVDESICQPQWSPDGQLYFVSDRSGWWNIYRHDGRAVEPVCHREAEFGRPQWGFGLSTYAFESPDHIICAYSERGIGRLAWLTHSNSIEPIDVPYTDIYDLQAAQGRVLFPGGSPGECMSIVLMDVPSGHIEILRRSTKRPAILRCADTSRGLRRSNFRRLAALTHTACTILRPIPSTVAPEGEAPALLVKSHGGPTAAASSTLDLLIQFWTSRGIAVLDVNYGGSSGFGREYRERLATETGALSMWTTASTVRNLADAVGWIGDAA